ncbi:hypothetical protein TRV_00916 [Trichophyton verrucosum HKI 0517]|uniref:SUN domain protein (Adg3) n=1 Tax=Trichophyton verrucosum (strain HKI 0517) TaxID=663202 RepID=D4D1G6_TRIVH|nr:uncharacterized protein TRV_00916 [Trichophyton verrucosum HKI 0517]EFE44300.1 hypothetical protein TRV_00916 [Trichophyton verrucosum HKI 0517]
MLRIPIWASAVLFFLAGPSQAGHADFHSYTSGFSRHHGGGHQRFHRSVPALEAHGVSYIEKRGGQCQFPADAGLVAVTPNAMNAGWAMSPDQPCKPDSYCPYACPSGQVMAQWDPKATAYTYPASMNGGLYCDKNGKISKPFPEKPYCVDASGPVKVKNSCGGVVSFCQTVLPGNEAMLIPTSVQDTADLAVPDPSYWCSTAAHYYINPPGTDTDTACVWGTNANPWGNWSPYVSGANTDHSGQTFLKLGWNPIYLETATPFRDESPKFGVKVECEGCNGLPCEIDPAKNKVNEITGSGTDGAGGAAFCVVTVPKGTQATIVVFEGGNSGGSGDYGHGDKDEKPKDDDKKEPKPSSSSSSPAPSSTPSSSSSTQSPTPTSTSASSSSESTPTPTSSYPSKSSSTTSSSATAAYSTTSKSPDAYIPSPHVFIESPSSSVHHPTNGSSIIMPTPTNSEKAPAPTHNNAASAAAISVMSLTLSFLIVTIFVNF